MEIAPYGIAETEVFRSAHELDRLVTAAPLQFAAPAATSSDGHLTGDDHDRAVLQVRYRRPDRLVQLREIEPVLVVHGRVERDEEEVRVGHGPRVGGEGQAPARDARLDERVEPGLEDRRPTGLEPTDHLRRAVDSDDAMAELGPGRRDHAAEMPEADDGDELRPVHSRAARAARRTAQACRSRRGRPP